MSGQQYPIRLDLNQPTTPSAPVQGYPVRFDLSGSGPVKAIPAPVAQPASSGLGQALLSAAVGAGGALFGPGAATIAGFLPRMLASGGDLPPAKAPAAAAAVTPVITPAAPVDPRAQFGKIALNVLANNEKTGLTLQQLQGLAGLTPAPMHYTGKDVAATQAMSAYEGMFGQALKEASTIKDPVEQEKAYIALQQKRADFYKELSGVKDDPITAALDAQRAAAGQ